MYSGEAAFQIHDNNASLIQYPQLPPILPGSTHTTAFIQYRPACCQRANRPDCVTSGQSTIRPSVPPFASAKRDTYAAPSERVVLVPARELVGKGCVPNHLTKEKCLASLPAHPGSVASRIHPLIRFLAHTEPSAPNRIVPFKSAFPAQVAAARGLHFVRRRILREIGPWSAISPGAYAPSFSLLPPLGELPSREPESSPDLTLSPGFSNASRPTVPRW